jgi:hypothetical protein
LCDAADISAAVTLARCALRVGSGIDVFGDGCFWEAEIESVCSDGYKYRFLHTRRQREYGRVLRMISFSSGDSQIDIKMIFGRLDSL